MIGLDTNILVRFLINDEPAQTAKVAGLIQTLTAEEQGWVSLAVVMELTWVLTKIYRISRSELIQLLKSLLSRKELLLEQPGMIHSAIDIYRKTNVSFVDCLIVASAHAAGCSNTSTFDQAAAKTAGMTLLL